MTNTRLGIAQSQTLHARSCCNFFDRNYFEIYAPQCPTYYSPRGSGDVLDIVVHKNIRLSNDIVSDILDSGHLPIIFHILDHVRSKTSRHHLINLQTGSGFKA
jgi:hypothetical protein